MAIAFNCPHCGEAYRLKDDLGGKKVTCRKANCRKTFIAPPAAAAAKDLEAVAAAAFADDAAEAKAKGPQGTIKVTCSGCDHSWEVDRALEGKNVPCPECRKIVKVPLQKETKPADWRSAGGGRPSLAKREEKLEGAWDTERKYAGAGSLQAAGAVEVEEEEPEPGAQMRRVRNVLLVLGVMVGVAAGIMALVKSRKEVKQERSLAESIKEVEAEPSLKGAALFEVAILRAVGEHRARSIQSKEDLVEATNTLTKAASLLQKTSPSAERDGLLMEVVERMTLLGGSPDEVTLEKRHPWTPQGGPKSVQTTIRQTLQGAPPQGLSADRDLKLLALRRVARKLPPQQAEMVIALAQEVIRDELAEVIGQTGMELVLANRKDAAKQVLEKALTSIGDAPDRAANAPSLTALRVALGGDQPAPLGNLPAAPAPAAGSKLSDISRIAYAEGLAAQDKFDQARKLAEQPGAPEARVRALTALAAAAVALKKLDAAGGAAEAACKIVAQEMKGSAPSVWLVIRVAAVAAEAGKADAANAAIETISDESAKSWARLEVLRGRLASQVDQAGPDAGLGPDAWLESFGDPAKPRLTQALAREELARHNARIGQGAYSKTVDTWPKGTMRPFGQAGLALGAQDRSHR